MKTLIIASLILFFIMSNKLNAQQTGIVSYPEYGLQFSIPENWMGKEADDMYIMGSNIEAGRMVLFFSEAESQNQLIQQLKGGFHDQAVQLNLKGALNVGTEQITGMYEGLVSGQSIKAFLISKRSKEGKGLIIVSLIERALYGQKTIQLAKKVANSVQFFHPIQPADPHKTSTAQCIERVNGNKLVWVDYYNSPDRSGNGSGLSGGYDLKKEINLCASSVFTYFGSSFVNVGSENASVFQDHQAKGHGNWKIVEGEKYPLLILTYHDGNVQQMAITMKDGKTFLDGERYYVVDGECY
ncbi:hypothetical protein ABN763_09955 [Spongiivirga sp. MCCC 1A20706]|uniref:hypothetical protein n=1 Tax=Spongiivirga sp. MCCC 1A20706 TaxID=3160963 RepID=UPI003977379D